MFVIDLSEKLFPSQLIKFWTTPISSSKNIKNYHFPQRKCYHHLNGTSFFRKKEEGKWGNKRKRRRRSRAVENKLLAACRPGRPMQQQQHRRRRRRLSLDIFSPRQRGNGDTTEAASAAAAPTEETREGNQTDAGEPPKWKISAVQYGYKVEWKKSCDFIDNYCPSWRSDGFDELTIQSWKFLF